MSDLSIISETDPVIRYTDKDKIMFRDVVKHMLTLENILPAFQDKPDELNTLIQFVSNYMHI